MWAGLAPARTSVPAAGCGPTGDDRSRRFRVLTNPKCETRNPRSNGPFIAAFIAASIVAGDVPARILHRTSATAPINASRMTPPTARRTVPRKTPKTVSRIARLVVPGMVRAKVPAKAPRFKVPAKTRHKAAREAGEGFGRDPVYRIEGLMVGAGIGPAVRNTVLYYE